MRYLRTRCSIRLRLADLRILRLLLAAAFIGCSDGRAAAGNAAELPADPISSESPAAVHDRQVQSAIGDTIARAVIGREGGSLTVARAATVLIDAGIFADRQHVTLVVTGDARAIEEFAESVSSYITEEPHWIGRLILGRACPAQPIDVIATVSASFAQPNDTVRAVPFTSIYYASATELLDQFEPLERAPALPSDSTITFALPPEAFSADRAGAEGCDAFFAVARVRVYP